MLLLGKEYRKKKIQKYLVGWSHIVNLVWGEKEQENMYRAQTWLDV